VEVALEPPPLADARFDDPCSRGGQPIVCFDALEGERHELCEVCETPVGVGSEVVRRGREDEERSPGTAGGMDRSDDGG
jgi:hypothetical protein